MSVGNLSNRLDSEVFYYMLFKPLNPNKFNANGVRLIANYLSFYKLRGKKCIDSVIFIQDIKGHYYRRITHRYEDDYSSILCNIVDSKMESGCSFEEALSEYVIEYPEMTFERAKSLYEKWHK